jgi:hypothetical protein
MTDALVTTFHGDTADPPLGDSVSASVDGDRTSYPVDGFHTPIKTFLDVPSG